jgi:arylsulfatase A-like enzyme
MRAARLLALALVLTGCGKPTVTTRIAQEEAVLLAPGLELPAGSRVEDIRIDFERRSALMVPAGGTWRWRLTVPPGARFEAGVGRVESGEGPPLRAVVELASAGGREVLDVADVPVLRWVELRADLSAYADQEVTIELRLEGLPAGQLAAWGPVAVTASGADRSRAVAETRPNIVFVLLDTVRHDHLKAYGYDRDTAPELDRHLVASGMVVERAYAQAPWTLPSAVSYMTSRYPGELLGRDPAAYGIPAETPSLPEVLQRLGYRTAGFLGNPTLREENGFGRGFDTFHSPEGLEALYLNASDLHRRIEPWLRAHQHEPFFLYAHYIDPHDPYANPELVDGKSPWFDDPGGISGEWIHGVYAGVLPLEDAERDRRHLISLYDSEIRFADRYLGRLVEALEPEVLARTLFVFASDHGEEFFDHGGWKHGQSLYEEQIRVPLVFRWDGRIAPGSRLDATVRLLDVAPTLVAAAGGESPADWQGVNLLPALTGEAPAPRLAAFSQHLAHGPLRAAAVLDGKKLLRFNRLEPFTPADSLQDHLYRVDLGRLGPLELYDLAEDPAERRNLVAEPGAPALVAPLSPVLASHLDRALVGSRALTEGLAPGAVLAGELELERAPEGWRPLFLGAEDRVELDGTLVRFRLVAEIEDKGFLLMGDPGDLLSARLTLDGSPLPSERLRLGVGAAWGGGRVPAASLLATRYPAAGKSPGLRLWRPSGARPSEVAADPATREGLRALGYIQ